MANQEQQDQREQGRQIARPPQSAGNPMTRGARNPGALLIAPAAFFRMSPFTLMRRMSDEMERVLGESGGNRGEAGTPVWAPAIEVSQTDDKYTVRAELAGINPDDVKIEVTDESVIIEGERKTEMNEDRGGVHVTERQYGRFYRAIPLPEGVNPEEAKATFQNGVLEITIPVQAQKEQRRQIPIESTPQAQAQDSGKAA
ncbi:MAG: heat shock protein Hsp20 [Candidatus Solibacter sp.]|nr:heat shock protein Hsp20 [Candidatus Solibacter sp.]